MTPDPMPRLALRPNPTQPLGWDLYVYDDGNAWTGWLRLALADVPVPDWSGVLTADGERDLVELLPYPKTEVA